MVKIGINGRHIFHNDGMGQYVRELVKALSSNTNFEKSIYLDKGDKENIIPDSFQKEINLIFSEDSYFDNFYFPNEIKEKKIDIWHQPHNFNLPFRAKCKKIITIHDIIPYFYEQHRSKKKFPHENDYLNLMKLNVKHADLIFADSIQTKNDLIKYTHADENKVKVVYLSLPETFKVVDRNIVDEVKTKYGVNKKFIIYNGGIYYRKNISGLIKAFKSSKYDGLLLIPGKGSNKIQLELQDMIDTPDIKLLGFIPFNDLVALYNAAEMLVYPSFYEGFGYPILEAYACGCPVITSNIGSMAEIAGQASLLVDPNSIEDISSTISKLENDAFLREQLITKGFEEVKKFSFANFKNNINNIFNNFIKTL